MSIIKCPECGHQISEKATVCPICGIGIAGKVVRCAFCGEVYLRSDGLCPNCHRPAKALKNAFNDVMIVVAVKIFNVKGDFGVVREGD